MNGLGRSKFSHPNLIDGLFNPSEHATLVLRDFSLIPAGFLVVV